MTIAKYKDFRYFFGTEGDDSIGVELTDYIVGRTRLESAHNVFSRVFAGTDHPRVEVLATAYHVRMPEVVWNSSLVLPTDVNGWLLVVNQTTDFALCSPCRLVQKPEASWRVTPGDVISTRLTFSPSMDLRTPVHAYKGHTESTQQLVLTYGGPQASHGVAITTLAARNADVGVTDTAVTVVGFRKDN